MITGAARRRGGAAGHRRREGVQENSRRHGYMMSMLGIRQLAVLVNKMDLVDWDQAAFDRIVAEYGGLPRPGRRRAGVLHPGRPAATATTSPTRSTKHAVVHGSHRARGARRFRSRAAPVERAVPHAGAGRLQVHQAGRRPPDRGGHHRDRPRGGRRRGGLLSLGQEEPGQVDRGVQPAPQTSAAGRRGRGLDARSEQIYIARGEMATLGPEPRPR